MLCEIERVGLSRQIEGPDFDLGERDRAVVRRERVVVEWGEIMVELYELRERYPRELELTPRAKMNYGRGPGERRALNHERASDLLDRPDPPACKASCRILLVVAAVRIQRVERWRQFFDKELKVGSGQFGKGKAAPVAFTSGSAWGGAWRRRSSPFCCRPALRE